MGDTKTSVDVQKFVDDAGIGGPQLRLFLLCLLILILDGYDTVVVGYIAPQLRVHWGITPTQLAPLFGVGLFGLTVGSLVLGPVADRIGRRATLIWSVALFGAASLASALAPSLNVLIVLRFLTGLGLGGAMPNVYTLAAEYSPTRLRASLVAPIGCGLAVGGAVAGLFASRIMQAFGWQSMFVIGGFLPLILIPVLIKWLPESARYQIARGQPDAQVRLTMRKMFRTLVADNVRFELNELRPTGSPVTHLFTNGLATRTVLLWITAFGALLVVYFLGSWLPVLIQEGGAPVESGALMMSCYLFGNTFGAIALGLLMDRFNPQAVLCAAFLAGCVALGSFGSLIATPWLAFLALFVTGVGTGGTTTGTNILAAGFYPTASRATGVSWTLAFGRLGSIVGSVVAGFLLAAKWPIAHIFMAAAVPLLLAAVTVATLGQLRANKRIDVEPLDRHRVISATDHS